MADLGSLITIADKIFNLLQSPVLKELKAYETDLKKLNDTVISIKSMFLDVHMKVDLSNGERLWIQRLKDALYDADDLIDEYVTHSEQKQLVRNAKFSKKYSQKVIDFFSYKNALLFAYHASREVKSIREKLDEIARDHERYDFKVDSQALRRRREETCSYVYSPDIIGRDKDLKTVVGLLLDSNAERNVSFHSIVGVGGLGKTTLAQLVYDDFKIKQEFPSRLWVCVSDQGGVKFDEREILCKIHESVTGQKPHDGSSKDVVQCKIKEVLGGKKFLLVLDDVWNEDRHEWSKLRNFLMIGGTGSSILVTTRSKMTAKMVADSEPYELEALSPEDSWHLFAMTAFDQSFGEDHDLVQTGKKIVEKCSNIPLAIKVVGSLLYGQELFKWQSLKESGLAEINNGENQIMSVLKLSYDNLEPSLKCCFSYCALFPKNFVIRKDMLISLWMAQGYLVPLNGGESMEDAGEEHFSILLRRCFFQDVINDELGVFSVKIHDLMHDVALEVAGNEICMADSMTSTTRKEMRHLFLVGGGFLDYCFNNKLRSCMNLKLESSLLDAVLVEQWACLRTLQLKNVDSKNLPNSIGKLLHLRCLDLSGNHKLETLSNSISNLYNLQTLILTDCSRLKELPKRFSKLVKLRHLDLTNCYSLTHMPCGMDKLTCLRVLTDFVVGDVCLIEEQHIAQLADLKALVHLKGRINIHIRGNYTSAEDNVWMRGWLEGMNHLKVLSLQFPFPSIFQILYNARISVETVVNNEALIEKLLQQSNLGKLVLGRDSTLTLSRGIVLSPYLAKIEIVRVEWLQHLPPLSKLQHLKFLELYNLESLEYIENPCTSSCSTAALSSGSSSNVSESTFFPSLESLVIEDLPILKGWWRPGMTLPDSSSNSCWHRHLSFPCLSALRIRSCPDLTSFPPCPSLESLSLEASNELLRISMDEDASSVTSSSPCYDLPTRSSHLYLRLQGSIDFLKSLPAHRLKGVDLWSDDKLESLLEIEEVLKGCSSSLRSLGLCSFSNLSSLSGGLEHLTALESLVLHNIPELSFPNEDYIRGTPWRSFHQSLRSLGLYFLPKLLNLPDGMQCLTSLQHLTIEHCENLQALPKWISCLSTLQSLTIISCCALKSLPEALQKLTSLQKLKIFKCPELTDICQEPNGKDWPKIKHISSITIF